MRNGREGCILASRRGRQRRASYSRTPPNLSTMIACAYPRWLSLVFVLTSFLGGCSIATESNFKDKIKRELVDPESAQFRDLKLTSSNKCLTGEVNAKNRMGGYVGFKKFFASEQKVIIANETSDEMKIIMATIDCMHTSD